ncbi:HAD-IIB family hydrolase [Qipengyuania sp. MTN3-11]|uniref:HAD-IIB family hydrolase n=1 Tax=Qipengyuania sp. MTN3-11 TaxID=3056557 RepID=UPI0036F2AD3D
MGGCLKGEPVKYGITEDTGGHIGYILGEMGALARRGDVALAEIVTRRFEDARLGPEYARREEWIGAKCVIRRIDSGDPRYLAKAALHADRSGFTEALIADFRARDRLPDLIHAHFADAADVAARVEEALGIPFVYTAHSLGMDKREAVGGDSAALDMRIAEEDRAIRGARAIIGSSRDECERQLLAYPSAEIGRIHRLIPGVTRPEPSVSHARGRVLVEPFLRDPDKPMVLAIARPVHKKNLAALVEAFGKNQALRERCNLVVLAGLRSDLRADEPEQNEVLGDIVNAIDRHDLYGSVAYPKSHSRPDVEALYRCAVRTGGVFVNPALIEPYGLTLIEAASHGLPVVATQVGGPQDIVGELENGLLVDPHSTVAIAQAVERLIFDRAAWERCSRNGLLRSMAMDWDGYAEGFMAIARSVVEPRSYSCPCPNRLVVSDLDNTLTGCDRGALRFSGFFRRRPEFGFVVATGRSIVEARRLVGEWGLPAPIAWITSVGTEVYREGTEGLRLDPEFAAQIAVDWQPERISALLAGIEGLVPQAPCDQRAFKRSYFAETPALVGEVRALLHHHGLRAKVIFSHDRLLDVLPVSAGKAAAMRHVAYSFGIPSTDIFAAGDSGNDADMLTECHNAILVGNHAQEIAGLADRTNVYLARRHHASGALEGVLAQFRSRQVNGRRRAGGER